MAKSALEQDLEKELSEAVRFEKEILAQDKAISEAIAKRDIVKNALEVTNRKVTSLRELVLVETGLPEEILKVRERILRKLKQAKNINITVSKKNSLDFEVQVLISELQKSCPHTLVLITSDRYEGSYINEYDDANYGSRKCIICELTESSSSTKEDIYKFLGDREGRLAKRDLRDSEKNYKTRQPPWQPLDYFIEAFRRSAGCNNVYWPIIKNGKITEGTDVFLETKS